MSGSQEGLGIAQGEASHHALVAETGTAGLRKLLLVMNQNGQWGLPDSFASESSGPWDTAALLGDRESLVLDRSPSEMIFRLNEKPKPGDITTAALTPLPYELPCRSGNTAMQTLWTDLDSLSDVSKGPEDKPFLANHGLVAQLALNTFQEFDDKMAEAQKAHKAGRFGDARRVWQQAAKVLPDYTSRGRALRGEASSTDRLGGHSEAEGLARSALEHHGKLIDSVPGHIGPRLRREHGESHAVLGRILLGGVLREERQKLIAEHEARGQAQEAIFHFEGALSALWSIRGDAGEPDQHLINLLPRFVIAQSLAGDRKQAKAYLHETLAFAKLSESPKLPTAANLSPEHRERARRHSMARAYGARAVYHLANTRLRPLALSIALDPRFGL